jgi:hypothetical protein
MHKRLFVQMNKSSFSLGPLCPDQVHSFMPTHVQMRKRLNEQIHKCINVYLNLQTIV